MTAHFVANGILLVAQQYNQEKIERISCSLITQNYIRGKLVCSAGLAKVVRQVLPLMYQDSASDYEFFESRNSIVRIRNRVQETAKLRQKN